MFVEVAKSKSKRKRSKD